MSPNPVPKEEFYFVFATEGLFLNLARSRQLSLAKTKS